MSRQSLCVIVTGLTGCSSWINSVIGLPVTHVSLLPRTGRRTNFKFDKSITETGVRQYLFDLDNRIKGDKLDYDNDWLVYIPVRHGLDDVTIWDAGIIDEKSDIFEKAEKRFTTFLVVFVTEAGKAFETQKEVDYYKTVSGLLGHITKLGVLTQPTIIGSRGIIVVANKYDECQLNDKDFQSNYNKIRSEIMNDSMSAYKWSSHHMFMTTMITHKLDLFIPDCFYNELKRIMKTTECVVTSKMASDIKDNKMCSTDITLKTHKDKSLIGDWNDLIPRLQSINDDSKHMCKLNELTEAYICSRIKFEFFLEEYVKVVGQMNSVVFGDALVFSLGMVIDYLVDKVPFRDTLNNNSKDYFTSFVYQLSEKINYNTQIKKHMKKLGPVIFGSVYDLFHLKILNQKCPEILDKLDIEGLLYILGSPVSWQSNQRYLFYSIKEHGWIHYAMGKSPVHLSNLISELFAYCPFLRDLILIALCPIGRLNHINQKKLLPFEKLDKIQKGLGDRLNKIIKSSDNQGALQHEMFVLTDYTPNYNSVIEDMYLSDLY